MVSASSHQKRRDGWRYRANVASRTVAATLGGYGVAAFAAFAVARGLPGDRLQASLGATMLAVLLMPAAALWAFLAATPGRAWLVLLALAVVLGGIGFMLGPHP